MQIQLPTTTAPPPTPPNQRAHVRTSLELLLNPFTILVDTAEQHPFSFANFHADADRKNRLLVVTEGVNLFRQCLGRHPNSLGDYAIEEFIGRCHVERKSMADAHGTILGFDTKGNKTLDSVERRQRFEQELANLSNIEAGCVVVECTLGQLLDEAPEYDQGKKTAACNRKILHRSVIAWQQTYSVPWFFCDGRRQAEETAFRWMERFWEKHRPRRSRRKAEING